MLRRLLSTTTVMPGRYTNVHRPDVRKGAGDARPTALDIVRDENLAGKLKGKSALVTGTSSGIGIETARALAATGMHVFCTARNVDKGRKALADIKEEGEVELIEMNQSSLASVRKGAAEVLKKSGGKLNIFVANAGIMAGPYAVTQDGFEAQFGTNHLSHFLLFQLIKDALLAGSTAEFNSRVVVLSSSGHLITAPKIGDYGFQDGKIYDGWAAYGQSKTANIWMANEIERQYGDRGLHALSLHPGEWPKALFKETGRLIRLQAASRPDCRFIFPMRLSRSGPRTRLSSTPSKAGRKEQAPQPSPRLARSSKGAAGYFLKIVKKHHRTTVTRRWDQVMRRTHSIQRERRSCGRIH